MAALIIGFFMGLQFPRLIYKTAAIYKLVNDDTEYKDGLSDGWFPSVPEALAGDTTPKGKATHDELIQKAKELSLKFHHRTGYGKLEAMINEAL